MSSPPEERRSPEAGAGRRGGASSEGPDPFERSREDARAVRDAMEELRADVRAVVRDEVARAGMSGAELERMVRDAVAREVRKARPGGTAWQAPTLAAAGVVVGLLAGVLGYRAFAGDAASGPRTLGSATAGGEAAAPVGDAGGAPGAGTSAPVAEAQPTPADLAAAYDSLLAAGSERLAPMVGRLEAAGPAAPVVEAIGTWRAGGPLTPAQRRRLHDALVQLALNEVAGAGLALDGLVSRGPCRGNSCGALLELWRARGGELGLPELPDDPASDTATLAVVERVLVLRRADDDAGAGAGGDATG